MNWSKFISKAATAPISYIPEYWLSCGSLYESTQEATPALQVCAILSLWDRLIGPECSRIDPGFWSECLLFLRIPALAHLVQGRRELVTELVNEVDQIITRGAMNQPGWKRVPSALQLGLEGLAAMVKEGLDEHLELEVRKSLENWLAVAQDAEVRTSLGIALTAVKKRAYAPRMEGRLMGATSVPEAVTGLDVRIKYAHVCRTSIRTCWRFWFDLGRIEYVGETRLPHERVEALVDLWNRLDEPASQDAGMTARLEYGLAFLEERVHSLVIEVGPDALATLMSIARRLGPVEADDFLSKKVPSRLLACELMVSLYDIVASSDRDRIREFLLHFVPADERTGMLHPSRWTSHLQMSYSGYRHQNKPEHS